ncbi:MAG: hypothetical protein HC880_12080, partial [Bacteroidia bacterium]|nr:hypothetical protein [Bacteroidia bacterium]
SAQDIALLTRVTLTADSAFVCSPDDSIGFDAQIKELANPSFQWYNLGVSPNR